MGASCTGATGRSATSRSAGRVATGFRAPQIRDLYSAHVLNFPSSNDPCGSVPPSNAALLDQCRRGPGGAVAANNGDDSSMVASTVGGNPSLAPETAVTATIGIAWEPQHSALAGLSFTADLWTASLEGTFGNIGSELILAGCYPASVGSRAAPNQDYCRLITRSPVTGQITDVLDIEQNVGSTAANGLDLAARYRVPTRFGRLGFDLDASMLFAFDQTLPG